MGPNAGAGTVDASTGAGLGSATGIGEAGVIDGPSVGGGLDNDIGMDAGNGFNGATVDGSSSRRLCRGRDQGSDSSTIVDGGDGLTGEM